MKTIGLVGGTSWTSTAEYYRMINEEVSKRRGGLHSAKLVLASIDFAEFALALQNDDRSGAQRLLVDAANQLQRAGVDCVMLCSNLVHKFYDAVAASVDVPCLHIGDAIAAEIACRGYDTAALIGTKPLMEEAFFSDRIREKTDVAIRTPSADDREYIHTAIFERMCRNRFTDEDRARLTGMLEDMRADGARCALLCCTELPILLPTGPLPLLNSTLIHSRYGVNWALGA